MFPLVSVFFFISIPSASANDFCKVKQVVGNTYENALCSTFSDREVCDYSLGLGSRYVKNSSEVFMKEARKRNLSFVDCRVMTGLASSKEINNKYIPKPNSRSLKFCKNYKDLTPYRVDIRCSDSKNNMTASEFCNYFRLKDNYKHVVGSKYCHLQSEYKAEEKKVVSSYNREEFCEQIGVPDNVSWVGGSHYVSGEQCKQGWAPTTKFNYCNNAPSDYSGFKKFCSLSENKDEKILVNYDPQKRYNAIAFFELEFTQDAVWKYKGDVVKSYSRGDKYYGTMGTSSSKDGKFTFRTYHNDYDGKVNITQVTQDLYCTNRFKDINSPTESYGMGFTREPCVNFTPILQTNNEETKKQIATPIIKPEPEVITTNEETMVASAVEPQLARIGEAEFGFKCEWMHWNSKGSSSYNACIDTYINADKAEQEELRIARVEAENQVQQAKLLEDKMNELDRMYGATCKAMGLSKKDDEFPNCMMEMMKIEQEKEQAKIQNEIAMAQIQLQQAQLEAQNKAMDLRLAELEKNNELIREANIRSQKADAERNRQQQVLLKKQIALQEKKNRQDSWANALIGFSMLGQQQNTYQAPKTTRCRYTAYGFRCS